VGGTPTYHVNRDMLHKERRGWAQHENKAVPILVKFIVVSVFHPRIFLSSSTGLTDPAELC
jgi:hypothetical protein